MARQNQWQSFAQNFSGVYDAVNKGARGIEMGIASRADYNDPNGIALKGEALGLAKNQRLADIEAKYGDPTAGQTLLSTAADARAKRFENDLNTEIRPELVFQKGIGASNKIRAVTNASNASAANNMSQVAQRNAQLPGKLLEQDLTNAGLRIGNQQSSAELSRYQDMTPYLIQGEGLKNAATIEDTKTVNLANQLTEGTVGKTIEATNAGNQTKIDTASSNTEGIKADNSVKQTKAEAAQLKLGQAEEELESLIAANVSGNELTSAQNIAASLQIEVTQADEKILSDIWSDATGKDAGLYEDQEQATTAMLKQIEASDMSPENKLKYSKMMQENDLIQVGARAAEITQGMISAQQKGGVDGMVDFYAEVNDNQDGDIRRLEDGTVQAIVIQADGTERVVASANGANAEEQVERSLMQQVQNPLGAMGLAVNEMALNQAGANVEQTVANTENTEQDTLLKGAQVDQIASNIGVDAARVKQIESDIGLNDAKASLIVLQGAGQALQNDNFQAEFELEKANIESQVQLRGVQGSLSEANKALVAANVLRVKEEIRESKQGRYIRDPHREITAQEQSRFIEQQWVEVFNQAQALNPNISDQEARTLRETFEYSLVSPKDIKVTPVE